MRKGIGSDQESTSSSTRVLGMEALVSKRCKNLWTHHAYLEAVEAVNDDQKSVLFNKINAYFARPRQDCCLTVV